MIKVFGGDKCKYVADNIKSKNAWVLSICSDEKLPDELIKNLFNDPLVQPEEIHILGDITTTARKHWIASNLLIELIEKRFSQCVIKLFWYDGYYVNKNAKLTSHFHQNIICNGDHKTFCSIYSIDENIESFVQVEKSFHNNALISASFKIKPPFTAQLLSDMQKKSLHDLIQSVCSVTTLVKLRVPFCAIKHLKLGENLEYLDIRGNVAVILDFQKNHKLKYLNIAACELNKVQENILSLPQLETLLAYKNFISTIDFNSLKNIKRLSLYRNELNSIKLDYRSHPNLNELNLGANPLKTINEINTNYKNLKINLSKTHLERKRLPNHT